PYGEVDDGAEVEEPRDAAERAGPEEVAALADEDLVVVRAGGIVEVGVGPVVEVVRPEEQDREAEDREEPEVRHQRLREAADDGDPLRARDVLRHHEDERAERDREAEDP